MIRLPGTRGQPVPVRVRLDKGGGVEAAVMTLMHPDGQVIASTWAGPDGIGELTIPAWDGQLEYHLAVTDSQGWWVEAVEIFDSRDTDWANSPGLLGRLLGGD